MGCIMAALCLHYRSGLPQTARSVICRGVDEENFEYYGRGWKKNVPEVCTSICLLTYFCECVCVCFCMCMCVWICTCVYESTCICVIASPDIFIDFEDIQWKWLYFHLCYNLCPRTIAATPGPKTPTVRLWLKTSGRGRRIKIPLWEVLLPSPSVKKKKNSPRPHLDLNSQRSLLQYPSPRPFQEPFR